MSGEDPPPYVRWADLHDIEIAAVDEQTGAALAKLGFGPHAELANVVIRAVADDVEKARVFAQLRDAGICFSHGREWNPAEVFEWLRERGLLEGSFRRIAWSRPGVFAVREVH
jgi:hypothetical protein